MSTNGIRYPVDTGAKSVALLSSMPDEMPACGNCPNYAPPPAVPSGFDLGRDINGKYKFGHCNRFPVKAPREPHEVCGEHPENVFKRPDVAAMRKLTEELGTRRIADKFAPSDREHAPSR